MNAIDKIIFFELRHYGDLHITRNFVKYMINNNFAKEYTYVLLSDSKYFADFSDFVNDSQLKFEKYEENKYPFSIYSPWMKIENTLYINTSCGTNEMFFFNGTTIQTAHLIFSHYLQKFYSCTLSNDLKLFIPEVDFKKFKINNVDSFMQSHLATKNILIVNGECQSGQANNFDMIELITILACKYREYSFFITNDLNMNNLRGLNNVYLCKDIINIDENDIVETSYFSTFCDVIIGRASGVYSLSVEKTNIITKPKKFICISHTERDKDLGVCQILPDLAKNFIWIESHKCGLAPNEQEYNWMLKIIGENI
jgi:hypothetical protein